MGALALGASFACSSSEQPVPGSGSGGSSTGTGGAPAAGSPPIVAGAPAGGSAALAGAGNVGGTDGASGNSSSGAGNAASGGSASSSAGNAGSGGRPGAGGSAAGGSAAGGSAGSAGSSSAGAGTGGGSGTFAPCPTTGACKILPFGDSITFGLLAPDYATDKEGGYRAEIGTNDAGQSLTAQQMADNLGKLIDKVISTAPNALLVVGLIPPLSTQTAKVNSYNALIPPLVQTRAAQGKHILSVDHKLTAADMTGDNVHPNAGGYTKLGDSWYEVIKGYLRTGT